MDKETLIKVTNRDNGRVGYVIPEIGVMRQFMPRETKEITFDELYKLQFQPGGLEMLSNFLVIKNEEAVKELLHDVQPEYWYTEDDVERVMLKGSIDEFLDCLDFAPEGVLEIIKDKAVSLPLNDMEKRQAILDKLSFDVTRAIEIKNTKFDGGEEVEDKKEAKTRRVNTSSGPARRASTPNYKVVEK